jgi:hypothetical protein
MYIVGRNLSIHNPYENDFWEKNRIELKAVCSLKKADSNQTTTLSRYNYHELSDAHHSNR